MRKEKTKFKIKKRCVSCGYKLPGTEEYYNEYGNYCKMCSGAANRLALLTAKINNLTERWKKIGLTIEEIKKMKKMIKKREEIIKSLPNYCRIKDLEDLLC